MWSYSSAEKPVQGIQYLIIKRSCTLHIMNYLHLSFRHKSDSWKSEICRSACQTNFWSYLHVGMRRTSPRENDREDRIPCRRGSHYKRIWQWEWGGRGLVQCKVRSYRIRNEKWIWWLSKDMSTGKLDYNEFRYEWMIGGHL